MDRSLRDITIKEQLLKFGIFSEDLPPCFSTDKLAMEYDKIICSASGKIASECMIYTVPKDDDNRRVMKVPNIEQQIKLIELILKHEDALKAHFEKSHSSRSNPFRVDNYTNGGERHAVEFLDIPKLRDVYGVPSSIIANLFKKIRISLGYKYRLTVDLANFYDSIYTHSLEWALNGKENTKIQMAQKNNNRGFGQNLDNAIRQTNLTETSGIPTGPFTSRIVSEVLLVKVDVELETEGFVFSRYVDDYQFFFKSENDAIQGKEIMRRIFHKYNLKINDQKTDLSRYPYHQEENMRAEFERYRNNYKKTRGDNDASSKALVDLFISADMFYKNGSKGAYKYLLKMLKNEKFQQKCWERIEPLLMNICLISPRISQYVVVVVRNNREHLTNRFVDSIAENLIDCILNQYHNEAHWFLWLLFELDYKFSVDQIVLMMDNASDDISMMMLIAYAHRNKQSSVKIQERVKKYYDDLSQYSLHTSVAYR